MKTVCRPDTLDLEHLSDLGLRQGYRMVTDRLRAALAQSVADLEAAKTWEEARFIQGQIKALRLALGMPDLLAKEIRSKMTNQPKRGRL